MNLTIKKTLPTLTLMLALLFAVSTAMAQSDETGNMKHPKKMGHMGQMSQMSQMSPEDRAAWEALWKEHRQQIEPLRDRMWAKDMEYDFLVANPNTKLAEVKAVIDEMVALKLQMRAEHAKLAEAAKAKGLDSFGFHKGWRGPGMDGGCNGPRGHDMMGSGRHHGGLMMDD